MKISQDKKNQIRQEILEAAVDVIIEKGYKAATMREISRRAGCGDATIYNYFPNKDKILYGYFSEKFNQLSQTLNEIPEFAEFTLKEKFQTHLETLIEFYTKDREFVIIAYKLMINSPLRIISDYNGIKIIFTKEAEKFIIDAVEKNEIPEHPFTGFISNLYWSYSEIIFLYWLKDDSEGFSNTSQIIDLTLDIIVKILEGGILPKAAEVLLFVFRNHIYGNTESLFNLISAGLDSIRGMNNGMTGNNNE